MNPFEHFASSSSVFASTFDAAVSDDDDDDVVSGVTVNRSANAGSENVAETSEAEAETTTPGSVDVVLMSSKK
jgi:hypothetical protein